MQSPGREQLDAAVMTTFISSSSAMCFIWSITKLHVCMASSVIYLINNATATLSLACRCL